ncbi:MAG: DUF1365 domain-containing protein [Pirellulaceae bacterium]|nr:DUF1365 domain-containing protein [Pirellulaceae bacterium]
MHSCFYAGRVVHARYRPVKHRFRYRLFMLYLDLAEWQESAELQQLLPTRRFRKPAFRREDHLAGWNGPLDAAVRRLVEVRTGRCLTGPIRLLTQLRSFGYYFSPLNLFYCFDTAQRLDTVVAEVNNTPWREQHLYVLWEGNCTGRGRALQFVHRKEFHVSPFMDMNAAYHWSVSLPEERLHVHLANVEPEGRLFHAAMSLTRLPASRSNLRRLRVRHPWMTGQIVGAIHWQALQLWWKKCPFYTHPNKRPPTTGDTT